MNKKVSLKDIAARVGVSTALVSYVLNNKKEGRIGKDIAQKIRDAARQMNYRTNQIAKSLKTNKTFTVGLIVADISNPFSSALARIIEDEASKNNYTVLFGSSDENAEKFARLADTLIHRQVDGLILSPPAGSEQEIASLGKLGIPFVLIDRCFPSLDTNYVLLDNYSASFEATRHLAETGRKRIGMVTYHTELFHLQERKRGYVEALKENGFPFKKEWLKEVDISNNSDEIRNAIAGLLEADPSLDALFFGSNRIAAQGLKYLNGLPVTVPDDIAVVSFDETEELDLFYSAPTYVRQPLQEMGQKAIEILLHNIGSNNNEVMQVSMKAELVVRGSSLPAGTVKAGKHS